MNKLSSADIAIGYYKEEIEAKMAERRKDLKMKECKLKEKWRTVADLKSLLRKVYSYNFLSFFPYFHFIFFFHINS